MDRTADLSESPVAADSPVVRRTLEIIANVADVDSATLKGEQVLMADLGIDSPKSLRLLLDLEDGLNLEISDEDAALLETVGDIVDYVAAARASA